MKTPLLILPTRNRRGGATGLQIQGYGFEIANLEEQRNLEEQHSTKPKNKET
ncbi:hypothetical protein [Pedobacter sp. SYSU D00535]|uniref:hypothetical protein n=1 Tax=Pedobacter sp. SYSU D00535 TaxID=2810308 RepID=UPI001A9619AD|nr:hypothetical protein [Pedobacter sp. SYSU D00535]